MIAGNCSNLEGNVSLCLGISTSSVCDLKIWWEVMMCLICSAKRRIPSLSVTIHCFVHFRS